MTGRPSLASYSFPAKVSIAAQKVLYSLFLFHSSREANDVRWRDAARGLYKANVREYERDFVRDSAPPFQYGPDYLLVRYHLWEKQDLRRSFAFGLVDRVERDLLDRMYGVLNPERRGRYLRWVGASIRGPPPTEPEPPLEPHGYRTSESPRMTRAERRIADKALYRLSLFFKGERGGMAPWRYHAYRADLLEQARIISSDERDTLSAYYSSRSLAAMNARLGNPSVSDVRGAVQSFLELLYPAVITTPRIERSSPGEPPRP